MRFPMLLCFALLLPGLVSTAVSAGEANVYRCGDTYSQIPCGDNATQPKLYGARGTTDASAMDKAKSCVVAVAKSRFEEGLDWQLLDASEPEAELIPVHGSQILGYRLTVTMAQVSSQGQRLQTAQFACAVSQDLQRVLSLQALE